VNDAARFFEIQQREISFFHPFAEMHPKTKNEFFVVERRAEGTSWLSRDKQPEVP